MSSGDPTIYCPRQHTGGALVGGIHHWAAVSGIAEPLLPILRNLLEGWAGCAWLPTGLHKHSNASRWLLINISDFLMKGKPSGASHEAQEHQVGQGAAFCSPGPWWRMGQDATANENHGICYLVICESRHTGLHHWMCNTCMAGRCGQSKYLWVQRHTASELGIPAPEEQWQEWNILPALACGFPLVIHCGEMGYWTRRHSDRAFLMLRYDQCKESCMHSNCWLISKWGTRNAM